MQRNYFIQIVPSTNNHVNFSSGFMKCRFLLQLNEEESEQIERCNRQMGLNKGHLKSVLTKVALILSDTVFVEQLLDINNEINCLVS